MSRFSVPSWVNKHWFDYTDYRAIPDSWWQETKARLAKFHVEDPEVTICIPAWNEELSIPKTLSSLADMDIPYRVELIVINNNSKDGTQEILDRLGVKNYMQTKQGVNHARQLGLEMARGKYMLNADADSIYPPKWGLGYIKALENPKYAVAYGRYSFIPSPGNSRVSLGLYEMLAEQLFNLRRRRRDYLNVLGFNFAIRRADAFAVGGYRTDINVWEDGMMAFTLQEQVGKIALVASDDCRVWTSDRRLMADGSLGNAFKKRIKKEWTRLTDYVFPKKFKGHGEVPDRQY